MLNRQMWFGTRERMTAIRAPKIDYDASKAGWDGGVTGFLNGGAYVRRSTTSHKVYNFSWGNASRDEIRAINDYADGVYGDGPIYFVDPFAMDKNLLPQYWATPRLVLKDGPVLTGNQRNELIAYPVNLVNSLGYPEIGISYAITATTPATRPSITIPVPDGFTLWFGAHGVAASSSPLTMAVDNNVTTALPILDVNDSQRFSHSWNTRWAKLSFGGTGTATVTGMMVQILPTGVAPAAGGFISGQGNAGVRFATNPTLNQYSAAMDLSSLSAQLVEDETWR